MHARVISVIIHPLRKNTKKLSAAVVIIFVLWRRKRTTKTFGTGNVDYGHYTEVYLVVANITVNEVSIVNTPQAAAMNKIQSSGDNTPIADGVSINNTDAVPQAAEIQPSADNTSVEKKRTGQFPLPHESFHEEAILVPDFY